MADNYTFIDGDGATRTRRSEDISGALVDAVTLTDPSGNPEFLTPGLTRDGFVPLGTEQRILVATAPPYTINVAAFDPSVTHVMFSVSGDYARVRFDGTDPATAGWGHLLPPGENGVWSVAMAAAAKFCKGGSATAEIIVTPLS